MAIETESLNGRTGIQDRYLYVIGAISAITGAILSIHRLVIDLQLLEFLLPVVVALAVGGPIILGYYGNSFLEGVLIGVLPCAGAFVSILAWPPLDWERVETMVAMAFYGTGLALPLVSILFVAGVGLRRDGSLSEQKRELVLRVAGVIVLSFLLLGALEIGLIETYGDQ